MDKNSIGAYLSEIDHLPVQGRHIFRKLLSFTVPLRYGVLRRQVRIGNRHDIGDAVLFVLVCRFPNAFEAIPHTNLIW